MCPMYYMCRQMKCWGETEWNTSQKLKLKTEMQMVDKSVLKRLAAIWKLGAERANSNSLTVGRYYDGE